MPSPTLPLVRGGVAQATYPFTARVEFSTGIAFYSDGSEQRWSRRAPLWRFQLNYQNLPRTEQAAILTAFNAQRGAALSNLQANFSNAPGIGATFSNLAITEDDIVFLERRAGLYEVQFQLQQTQNPSFSAPSVSAVFPTLSAGVITQYPYAPGYRNLTTYGDSPTGTRYSSSWWGNGVAVFTGLPARPLRKWTLSTPVLPNADVSTLGIFCLWAQGMLNTFTVHDPEDGNTYTKCRLGSDVVEFQFLDVNRTAMTLLVEETN